MVVTGFQHTAHGIGQVEGGLVVDIQRTEQAASQGVVVQVTLVRTCVEVAMFLLSEGVNGHGGATDLQIGCRNRFAVTRTPLILL